MKGSSVQNNYTLLPEGGVRGTFSTRRLAETSKTSKVTGNAVCRQDFQAKRVQKRTPWAQS